MEDIPIHVDATLQGDVLSHVHNIITSFEQLSKEKRYVYFKDYIDVREYQSSISLKSTCH